MNFYQIVLMNLFHVFARRQKTRRGVPYLYKCDKSLGYDARCVRHAARDG